MLILYPNKGKDDNQSKITANMKNTYKKSGTKWNLLSACFILILLFSNIQCDRTPSVDESEKKPPVLLIIGEDLSQTFNGFTQITSNHLQAICKYISLSESGGKVFLVGIGTTTPTGYAACTISPMIKEKPNLTASEKIRLKEANKKRKDQNEINITTFLNKSQDILNGRNQQYTDINSFFEKVGLLANEPGNQNLNKWLYINSDGKQSTKASNVVNCNLKPSVIDRFYVSGWKTKNDCAPDAKFLSPDQFVQYFKDETIQ